MDHHLIKEKGEAKKGRIQDKWTKTLREAPTGQKYNINGCPEPLVQLSSSDCLSFRNQVKLQQRGWFVSFQFGDWIDFHLMGWLELQVLWGGHCCFAGQ